MLYYGARYYDWVIGRFTQPDTIIPNPYNPQSLNRYSYVYNNPLRYTDPTGHCPYCLTVAIGTAVDVAFDFFIAQATKTSFNFGESVALNLGINAATAGIGGKVAKLRHLGKLAGLAESAAKYGDEVVDAAKTASKVEDVRHATTSADAVQSILTKINPKYFDPEARFGPAFYLAQEGATAVAEVQAGGEKITHVIRFHLDISKAKVLDLTDPTVAKAWGYIHDPAADALHRAIAEKASETAMM